MTEGPPAFVMTRASLLRGSFNEEKRYRAYANSIGVDTTNTPLSSKKALYFWYSGSTLFVCPKAAFLASLLFPDKSATTYF